MDGLGLHSLLLRLGLCNLSLELGLGLDNSPRLRLHDLRQHGLGLRLDGQLLRLDTLGLLRLDGARLLLHHRLDLRLHRRRCHQLRGGLRLRLNDLALRLRLDSCDDPALRLLLLRLGLCNLSLELGLRLDNSLRLRLHDLRLYGLRLQLAG